MNSKRTISISQARKQIFDIAEEVQAPNNEYTLTSDGVPKAVIISAAEYESLMETLEVMRECPDVLKRSYDADKAIRAGKWSHFVTLNDVEDTWGYKRTPGAGMEDLVDSQKKLSKKKKNAVQHSNRKKSPKRTK